ncbi:RCC1 domain-containing protein [Candidatus Poriferisodalis sp.]|uniref:RCC1 domain-containing protein n=1 Tax=Candidatus Poriferisodalis sp. TaxID=3101277 RepID=UPI003B010B1C
MALMLVGGLLAVPAGAQPQSAFVDGAESWTESDCASQVPVVVASDPAAQSDIYSAVTFAGAIGSGCVVLAGARGEPMAAAQQARLDMAASGGWVLGGTAAVPEHKIAGRGLTRLAGQNRWHTARLVGVVAADPDGDIAALTLSTRASAGTAASAPPGVRTPPGSSGDCASQVPVVVASDPAAQSDIYSAVTFAGAIGSGCVVLAGARGEPMAAAQQARLDMAASGGWVLGGTAAVPEHKIAGRGLTRLAGQNRWHTARLVGVVAADPDGDIATLTAPAAHQPTTKSANPAPAAYTVAAGGTHSCAIGTDSTITCWGWNRGGRLDAPAGTYTAVAAGGAHSCALGTDGAITCWGIDNMGQADAPVGTYTAVAAGSAHSCAVGTDSTITCWGNNGVGQADAPVGTYTAVAAGLDHSCAVGTDGAITCWGCRGIESYGRLDAPVGTYTAVAAGGTHSCAVGTDGAITCWGSNSFGQADAPVGTYTAVAAGWRHSCAVGADGAITCWGNNRGGRADAPVGTYTAVAAGLVHSCVVGADGAITCWGENSVGQTDVPTGF